MIGKKISHYRVVAEIGSGGMGVVYQAEDDRLGRPVAIKLLPDTLAKTPEAVERFEREVRAAAAMNHPNVCTVYDVGEWEGRPFLVMERLSGRTLLEEIGRRPIALDRLLEWGAQIAGALDAAHSRGIVHRDIKPTNIFITDQGAAKILDFGLAKIDSGGVADPYADTAPMGAGLAGELLTSPGAILGTVAYMSPEQARGDPLDARTDLFSLGAVLYEMATGRPPFLGRTPATIFNSILNEEPPDAAAANPELPPFFSEILVKALEKDRELRYQTAADLRTDLLRLRRSVDSGHGALFGRPSSPRIRAAGPPPNRRVLRWTAGAGALAAIAAAWLAIRARGAAEFEPGALTPITSVGDVGGMEVSPDGRYLAYYRQPGGRYTLWLRLLATGNDVLIAGPTEELNVPEDFSPDGNFLYFVRRDPKTTLFDVFRVAVLGGKPEKILEAVKAFGAFALDGKKILFFRNRAGGVSLCESAPDGSAEREFSRLSKGEWTGAKAFSPDRSKIAFLSPASGDTPVTLRLFSLSGAALAEVQLPRLASAISMTWSPDARSIFVAASTAGELTRFQYYYGYQIWQVFLRDGRIRQVTNDGNVWGNLRVVERGKKIIAIQDKFDMSLWVTRGDATSQPVRVLNANLGFGGLRGLAWTPEGKLLYVSSVGPAAVLFQTGPDGVGSRSLTPESWSINAPSVPGDGRYVYYAALHPGRRDSDIWRQNLAGGSPIRILSGALRGWSDVSPDGKWVVYAGPENSLWKAPLSGGRPEKFAAGPSDSPAFSPDSASVAYFSVDAGGKLRLKVRPTGGGSAETKSFDLPTGTVPEAPPRWLSDGTAVGFVAEHDRVGNIWSQAVSGGPPSQITNFGTDEIGAFAWSRDGGKLAVSRGRDFSDVVTIDNNAMAAAQERK